MAEELYYGLAGISIHKSIEQLNERFSVEIDSYQLDEWENKFYRESLDQIKPVESIVDLLKELVSKLKLAVA